MNARKLSLKRETLTQLTASEMAAVAGGSHFCGITDYCTDDITHGASLDQPCYTLPVYNCLSLNTCFCTTN